MPYLSSAVYKAQRKMDMGPSVVHDLPGIKARDPALARSWQQSVRTWMLAAFARGYVACDFVREQDGGGTRGFYVLRLPRPGFEL